MKGTFGKTELFNMGVSPIGRPPKRAWVFLVSFQTTPKVLDFSESLPPPHLVHVPETTSCVLADAPGQWRCQHPRRNAQIVSRLLRAYYLVPWKGKSSAAIQGHQGLFVRCL